MPTYDYECRSCGNRIEVIHGMLEDGPSTCEVCGGPLKRVLYPAGIIFKGSGFYSTDSRSGAGATGGTGKGASTAGSGDGSSAGTSTDAAPAGGASGGNGAASSGASTEKGTSGTADKAGSSAG